MRIGTILKKGKAPKKSGLYQITENRTLEFREQTETGTDVVLVEFELEKGQYGVYGEEFKPDFVSKEGAKKADIFAMLIDERQNEQNQQPQFCSWIFDVKESVGGEDVISHLIEQLKASYQHKKSIAIYLAEFQEEAMHIGFITRELQTERIARGLEAKARKLAQDKAGLEKLPTLIRLKQGNELLKVEKELALLQQFARMEIELDGKCYPLEFYQSYKNEDTNEFICKMNISCKDNVGGKNFE